MCGDWARQLCGEINGSPKLRRNRNRDATDLSYRCVASFSSGVAVIHLFNMTRSGAGQGPAEYAFILALIAIAAVLALLFLSGTIRSILSIIGTKLQALPSPLGLVPSALEWQSGESGVSRTFAGCVARPASAPAGSGRVDKALGWVQGALAGRLGLVPSASNCARRSRPVRNRHYC